MKLSTKNVVDKDKKSENVPKLESVEVDQSNAIQSKMIINMLDAC